MTTQPLPNEPAKTESQRVAFCITELDPGGAERALFETVTRLDRDQWEPKVFCLGGETPLAERFRNAAIEVVCYDASPSRLISTVFRLRFDLKRFRPAVLSTSLFHANFVGRLAACGTGIPVIAGHRVAERHAQWHLVLERLTSRLVRHHVSVSESVRSFLIEQRIATESNSSVIYNGVDVERFSAAEPVEYDAPGPVVLFVGRLTPQKGIETLFAAWRTVASENPDARLVIAGSGPLEPRVHEETESASVDFIGFQEDIAGWYARADVVVLPSRWEGLPNVLLESLAAGTPCVVANVEGVTEVFGDDLATVVDPCDRETLSARLISVLSDLSTASDRTISTQTSITKRFTWKQTASRTAEVLRIAVADNIDS